MVSVSGDGGFLFSAQGLETTTRLGLKITHIILRDNTYDSLGFQEMLRSQYDVERFGARGYRVSSLDEFSSVLQQAMDQPGPTIMDVPVDYRHNVDLAAHLPDDPFH